MKNKTLEECLVRNGNNLDLVRILAAIAVIYGHAFAFGLAGGGAGSDLVFQMTGHYAGELALKTFFFMSGLLITNSLMKQKSVFNYLVHRFFRIMPGLLFVLVFTALVVGPLFTDLSLEEYFKGNHVFDYVKHMALMNSWGTQSLGYYDLPGLFLDSPVGRNVNAPLWTLAVEVFAYFFILATFLAGSLNKRFAVLLFAVILLDSLLSKPILFFWLPMGSEFSIIPYCFAVGGLLAVYKGSIRMGVSIPLGFLILSFIFQGSIFDTQLFYAFFFTTVLYLSTLPFFIKMRVRHDISYGVYVWGWLVQQVVISLFPTLHTLTFQIISILVAIFFGYLSWIFIEKPSIMFGQKITVLQENK